MGHDDRPVHQCVSSLALLHQRKMQALEITVVEEQRLALVEGDGAARFIVVDVDRIAFEGEAVGALHQESGEKLEGRGIGCHEFVGRLVNGLGQEDPDVRAFADERDVFARLGITISRGLLDGIDFRLARDAVGIVRSRSLDGVDQATRHVSI